MYSQLKVRLGSTIEILCQERKLIWLVLLKSQFSYEAHFNKELEMTHRFPRKLQKHLLVDATSHENEIRNKGISEGNRGTQFGQ